MHRSYSQLPAVPPEPNDEHYCRPCLRRGTPVVTGLPAELRHNSKLEHRQRPHQSCPLQLDPISISLDSLHDARRKIERPFCEFLGNTSSTHIDTCIASRNTLVVQLRVGDNQFPNQCDKQAQPPNAINRLSRPMRSTGSAALAARNACVLTDHISHWETCHGEWQTSGDVVSVAVGLKAAAQPPRCRSSP